MQSLTEKNAPPPLTTTEKAFPIDIHNGNECLAPTHTTESVGDDDNNNSNGGNNGAAVVGGDILVAPAIENGSDDADKLEKLLSKLGVSSVKQSSSEGYNKLKEEEPRVYAGSRGGGGGGGGAAAGKVTAAKSADSGYESKKPRFTEEEDEAILDGYKEHGNKWKDIQRGNPALAKRSAKAIWQRYTTVLSPEAQEKKKKKKKNNSKKKRSSKKNDDELFEVDDDDELEVEEEEEKNNNKKKRKKNKSSSHKKKNDDDDDVYVPPNTAGGRGDRARKRLKDKENRHNRNLMIEEML